MIKYKLVVLLLLRTSSISILSSVPLITLNIKFELLKHGNLPIYNINNNNDGNNNNNYYYNNTVVSCSFLTLLANSLSMLSLKGAYKPWLIFNCFMFKSFSNC